MRDSDYDHAVVIAGGGPTGLMLAGELALAGVDVAIVERRTSQQVIGQRAGGLHCRTIELLDQRGIAERFLAAGRAVQVAGFAQIRLDISDFPTPHPYGLALWQNEIERLLADWVDERGVPVRRGAEVTGFTQRDAGVEVELSDGGGLRAEYLLGCDGGRSLVRKVAGIGFPGWDPVTSYLIAQVEVRDEPTWGIHRDALGTHGLDRQNEAEPVRVMVTERTVGPATEPTLADLSAALTAVYGTDFGIHSPTSIARFTDAARQAATYRDGRILLAGDAAHVHHPIGGQGLNTGLQDAVNLGWKLAQVVNGTAPDSVLDTYHAERHPVGARVLQTTMAQMALLRTDDRTKALHDNISEMLGIEEARKTFAARMSGLDIHYENGAGHPLLGRRMPDLHVQTAVGPLRIFESLHAARPVLLDLDQPGGIDLAGWGDRVSLVTAQYRGAWELPALGEVAAPTRVLIRPDGYVAWVGESSSDGLTEALTSWFGPPM